MIKSGRALPTVFAAISSFLVAWFVFRRCMRLFFVTTPSGMQEQYFGSDLICLIGAVLVGICCYLIIVALIAAYQKKRLN